MRKLLTTQTLGQNLIVLKEVDSTNTYCRLHPELPDGTLVMAEKQTAGRGRNGRSWQAQAGQCALFSLCIDGLGGSLAMLPFACGMAVCDAAASLGVRTALKWPNDVLADGKKLCGILCESRIEGDRVRAIAGIGINLAGSAESFAALGLPDAISLSMLGAQGYAAHEVTARIVNALEGYLSLLPQPEKFLDSYRCRCLTLGQRIEVVERERSFSAVAEDIASDGSLLVRCENGDRRTIYAADVKIKGLF